MARKNIRGSLNHVRRKGRNLFRVPREFDGPKKAKPMVIRQRGLKPNTKYKVMLDNRPGKDFEDITHTAKPVGAAVRFNTLARTTNRRTFIKTDKKGNLDVKCLPFGSDDIECGGGITQKPDHRKIWKYWHTRGPKNDNGRDRIRIIPYNLVDGDKDAADKIKPIKRPFGSPPVDPQPGSGVTPPVLWGPVVPIVPSPEGENQEEKVENTVVRGNIYQTFYIDSKSVDDSDTVDLLDVVLYVRSKTFKKSNASGREGPGINIQLLECETDGTPIINRKIPDTATDVSWHQIKSSPLADRGTVFKFDDPVTVRTNRFYAIAIQLEDTGFVLWDNRKGDMTIVNGVKTEERSQGSSKGHRGDVYYYNDDARQKRKARPTWQAQTDLDIKFDVNIAEYSVANVDVTLVNSPYEFFNVNAASDDWHAGELVYKQPSSYAAGTVEIKAGENKIKGVGTNFTTLRDGQKIVIVDTANSELTQVFTVDKSIAGTATTLYVDEYAVKELAGQYNVTVVGEMEHFDYYFNTIRLSDSSVNYDEFANGSFSTDLLFQEGDTIVGEDSTATAVIESFNPLPVSVFRANMNAKVPPQFTLSTDYNLSYQDAANSSIYYLGQADRVFTLNAPNHVRDYAGWIISNSQAVNQSDTNMTNNDSRSAQINISYQYNGANTRSYVCPSIDLSELEMITHRWLINNDNTNEHLNEGNANTRHISSTLDMGHETEAEDIRVVLNAWRPRGTNIEVYAKIQNDEDESQFEDAQWTKLELKSGENTFSNPEYQFSWVEMEYSFANYTEKESTLPGVYLTEVGNNIVAGDASTADLSTLSVDDVIRIYSPLFPDNYNLFTVEAANTTSKEITLNTPIANNNIAGEGFKIDIQKAGQAAFKNPDNYQIVRYFNKEGQAFDTYSKVAIKIVLLAEDRKLVPKVDDYRVIGVTA